MESRRDWIRSIGLLTLRLGIGGFMLLHGWGKLQMLQAGEFEKFADPIGLGNKLSLVMATLAEVGGSILVILGLGTRLAAIPLAFTMLVAAFVAHGNDPWTMGEGAKLFMTGAAKSWASKEPALLFLIPFLALIFTGPGCISIDALIASWWKRRNGP